MQCHFNSFLCLISFSLTSSLTKRRSDCGLWTTSGLWGSPRWSGELSVLGAAPYPTDLEEGNQVLQKAIFFSFCENGLQRNKTREALGLGSPFSLIFFGKNANGWVLDTVLHFQCL